MALDLLPLLKVDDVLERVGFILNNGEIVEVGNVAPDPIHGFDVSADDILKYLASGAAVATWHTHPGASGNLSVDDYQAFLNFPDVLHYIVGIDGVWCFEVHDGVVMNHAA